MALPELNRLAKKKKPFFMMLRHMDPHMPYLPPEPFERMFYQGNESDPNNRSIDACYQSSCNEGPGSNDPYIHYTYDKVGNRLTETRGLNFQAPTTTNYVYDGDDELTQTTGGLNWSFGYDGNGNLTGDGSMVRPPD